MNKGGIFSICSSFDKTKTTGYSISINSSVKGKGTFALIIWD